MECLFINNELMKEIKSWPRTKVDGGEFTELYSLRSPCGSFTCAIEKCRAIGTAHKPLSMSIPERVKTKNNYLGTIDDLRSGIRMVISEEDAKSIIEPSDSFLEEIYEHFGLTLPTQKP